MSEIVPVILCGGVGSRLWPLSRKSLPKQFAPLIGAHSLFEALDDAFITGPTGTNVNDFRALAFL